MRIQGFDLKTETKKPEARKPETVWILSTKRRVRTVSFFIGCAFFLISIWLVSTEKRMTFLIYVAIGVLLTGGAIFCDEIRISKDEINYKKAFPFRRYRKFGHEGFNIERLVSIHHGPVNLAIGLTQMEGYRAWFEFSDELSTELPLSVIYERTIKWTPSAPIEGERLAKEISENLKIPLVKSRF